jgi:3D (Asp-Asp-Asp) domain-containing protein
MKYQIVCVSLMLWLVPFAVGAMAVTATVVAPCEKTGPGTYDCTDAATYKALAKYVPWKTETPKPKKILRTTTAYNSVTWQTDGSPCISADGNDICRLESQGDHSCAASLPFGTKLDIPGYGVCTVRDRLAPKFADRVDIYFGGAEKIKHARKWGVRRLHIIIIDR